jgi:hypothetical protein
MSVIPEQETLLRGLQASERSPVTIAYRCADYLLSRDVCLFDPLC